MGVLRLQSARLQSGEESGLTHSRLPAPSTVVLTSVRFSFPEETLKFLSLIVIQYGPDFPVCLSPDGIHPVLHLALAISDLAAGFFQD